METTTGNRTRRFSRVLVVGLATAAVLAPSATAYPDSYNPAFDIRRLDDSVSVSRQPRFVIDMQVVPAATLTKSEVRTSGNWNSCAAWRSVCRAVLQRSRSDWCSLRRVSTACAQRTRRQGLWAIVAATRIARSA